MYSTPPIRDYTFGEPDGLLLSKYLYKDATGATKLKDIDSFVYSSGLPTFRYLFNQKIVQYDRRWRYIYDANNKLQEQRIENLNASGNWDILGRYRYTYPTDSNMGIAEEVYDASRGTFNFNSHMPTSYHRKIDSLYWIISANEGSSVSTKFYYQLDSPSAVKVASLEVHDHTFTLYPNPCSGSLQLTLAEMPAAQVAVTITTLDGRLICRQNLPPDVKYNLPLTDLQPGIYMLHLSIDGKTKSEKFTVR
ncbi:MAG: T9SS type A sorting domain-containing protein [Sphingobacteriales bacterium]|nr:MAG: T9SS type A sorting domain-containing protein [Sphingobacteriales bacterium]